MKSYNKKGEAQKEDLALRLSEGAIVAGIGDTHSNSTTGLMPPVTHLGGGATHGCTERQLWMWERFVEYWQRVYEEKVKMKLPVVAFLNGETADINKHSSAESVVTDEATAVSVAMQALAPVLDVADLIFVIRGTEAHTGKLSSLDEIVGERLHAVRDNSTGAYSWWNLYTMLGGVTFDVAHHPGHGHMRPWTRGGGANRLAISIVNAYQDAGETPPRVTLRGHNHKYEDSGHNFATLAVINHSWKLTDSYGYRIGAGRHPLPIGGQIFYCQNGRLLHDNLAYHLNPDMLSSWMPE